MERYKPTPSELKQKDVVCRNDEDLRNEVNTRITSDSLYNRHVTSEIPKLLSSLYLHYQHLHHPQQDSSARHPRASIKRNRIPEPLDLATVSGCAARTVPKVERIAELAQVVAWLVWWRQGATF